MAKIHKLTKGGQTIYPATTTDAVVNPNSRKSLTAELSELASYTILEWNTDAATTRKQVPTKFRKTGLQITYKRNNKEWIFEQFIGTAIYDSAWENDTLWQNTNADTNSTILEWNTDVAMTRKSIPVKDRKAGYVISYNEPDTGWINEQFVGIKLTDTEWENDNNWNRIPSQSNVHKIELATKKNGNIINSITGGKNTINSAYDMRYTNTSITIADGYAYREYTGAIANKVLNIPINIQRDFPASGIYHVFAKIRITIEAIDLKGVMTNSIQCNNASVTTNNTDVPVNELRTIYLGKAEFTVRPTYFYLSSLQLKTLSGGNPGGSYTVQLEYYGGYLIEDTIIGAGYTTEIANKLDYSQKSSTLELDGWKGMVENDLEKIHVDNNVQKQEIESVERRLEDTNKIVNNNFTIIQSAYDVRKEQFMISGKVTDEGDFLRTTASPPNYLAAFQTKSYFKAEAGTYSVFAKIKISEPNNTPNLFANVFLKRAQGGSSNSGKYNIPLNQLVSVYLGDFEDPGTNSYYYISLEYIRKGGPTGTNQTALGTVTFDFYGAYYVKEVEISDVKELISESINFKELKSCVILKSLTSETSKKSDKAQEADTALVSDLTNNINNIFRKSSIKIYGDSLVVYIGWNNLKRFFGVESVMNGIGGVKVSNNDKVVNYGLCTLERIASFPRNMKLLVIYGGANDNVATTEIPYQVDAGLLGSISDEPLPIADMLNYRITADNITNTKTPGRAQTFYQGYKTMLRNVMALYPNCHIICVTQHRYYYYLKPDGGFSEIPALRLGAYEKVKAIREVAEEYSVPVCDLWATSGVNDRNRRYTLVDLAGVLVHPTEATALREESLIINKILEIAPKFEIPNYITTKGEDVIEMREWVVDVRHETQCNVMTLQDAIQTFLKKTSDEGITLKNNMLLPFYYIDGHGSKVYVLKDYTRPSEVASWEEWVAQKIDDPNET
ncbi:SGNH/GDSL hydrolase family protein [Phocaeicola sartorii]|uniref:SGNH/GDSL hydrolase family protein n=1 Tax=Phocaeicola sartorii TaxID=671267 RepID=UPI0035134109